MTDTPEGARDDIAPVDLTGASVTIELATFVDVPLEQAEDMLFELHPQERHNYHWSIGRDVRVAGEWPWRWDPSQKLLGRPVRHVEGREFRLVAYTYEWFSSQRRRLIGWSWEVRCAPGGDAMPFEWTVATGWCWTRKAAVRHSTAAAAKETARRNRG